MKNKSFWKQNLIMSLILITGIYFSGCKKESVPPPTLDLYITVDGFTVNIAAESPEATSWYWDYGDGTHSDSVGSHTHTYAEGGTYTITCTVTGKGGETTKSQEVTIATIEELLTGGANNPNGKTWVVSRTAGPNDGVGFIKEALAPDYFPATDNMLDMLGLSEEYDNEYTFKYDGSYSLDTKNGNVLAGWVYADMSVDPGDVVKTTQYGIWQIKYPNLSGDTVTWAVHKNLDLKIESVYDANDDQKDGVPETVTFKDVDYLTFTGGAFIGLKDYTSTAIIRKISPDRMTLTLFFHSYYGDPATDGGLYKRPSFILTLSFDAK